MLFERQIKGIIALAFILAIIPFFRFVHEDAPDIQGPVFSVSGNRANVVELVGNTEKSGIYFVEPLTTLKHLLQCIDSDIMIDNDVFLENGTSVKLNQFMKKEGIVLEKISAGKRIALGMPLDVNQASFDDLMMVPGLGESTAEKIVVRRREIGPTLTAEKIILS